MEIYVQIHLVDDQHEVSLSSHQIDVKELHGLQKYMQSVGRLEGKARCGAHPGQAAVATKWPEGKPKVALTPCPSCISKRIDLIHDGVSVFFQCLDCGLKGPNATESRRAAELWNQLRKDSK